MPLRAGRRLMALLARLASALILLACWWLASRFVDPRTLPSPEAVAAFVGREAASGDLLRNIGITLWRVVASFVPPLFLLPNLRC
ncbi:hypothetical protein NS230_14815, partial [Methylobacterium indicum]